MREQGQTVKEVWSEADIDYLVKNYRFWKKEINRLENVLYGGSRTMSSWGVAQYGIDAAMPKGSSIRSAEELKRMDVRERGQIARLEKLRTYVYALEVAYNLIEDEQLTTIYDCLLDGMTYRQIAEHLSASKDYVRLKKQIIFSQISQNSQVSTILTYEKLAV
ncbi:sigma-70 family RNA polymerase sigma factor [Lysinibacillus sp. NPDC096418]|uniref:sigma-70 family RNA polymerase sigma factor n=1 Tax=Lysinibacillus sp. NPDC096418 TaxID=3364138 RepID=UPI003821F487